jgi:Na+/H+-dicarboxylate symporter
MKKSPWSILLLIAFAALIGSLTGTREPFFTFYELTGRLFLNGLTLVVVPLVMSSILTGVARIGGEEKLGRLGLKMFSFYIGTSLLAVLIGLVMVNLIHPGSPDLLGSAPAVPTVSEGKQLLEIFYQIVPANMFQALSQGQMLGLVFISVLFGYALSFVKTPGGTTLFSFFEGVFQTMLKFTQLIMKVLPLGVFCLVAKTFAVSGIGALGSLSLFVLTVISGLAVFTFIALPLLLKFVGRVSPVRHFQAMMPALVTAFSTSSSSASLPITIDCVEKRAGVSNRICSLVVPLGTSINMSGSALYECVAAMFVAQIYGTDLSFPMQFAIAFLSLVMSMGVAGIPGGSLVAILVILKTFGLPAEALGLFLAVDRILDMCRTTVNVFSDATCAVLVARSEGEELFR